MVLEDVFSVYCDDIELFCHQKGIFLEKWPHDSDSLVMGPKQERDDLEKIFWSLQLSYSVPERFFSLYAHVWYDKKYSVEEGEFFERFSNVSSCLIFSWGQTEIVPLVEKLEAAYALAHSYTKNELFCSSSVLKGKDGIIRNYPSFSR